MVAVVLNVILPHAFAESLEVKKIRVRHEQLGIPGAEPHGRTHDLVEDRLEAFRPGHLTENVVDGRALLAKVRDLPSELPGVQCLALDHDRRLGMISCP